MFVETTRLIFEYLSTNNDNIIICEGETYYVSPYTNSKTVNKYSISTLSHYFYVFIYLNMKLSFAASEQLFAFLNSQYQFFTFRANFYQELHVNTLQHKSQKKNANKHKKTLANTLHIIYVGTYTRE